MIFLVASCVVVILLDIVSGIIKALKNNGLNSTIMRKGAYNKAGELLAVGVSCLFEYGADKINLGVKLPLLDIVAVYIIITEIVSILENIGDINPDMKELFEPFLEKMRGSKHNEDDTNE